MTFTLCYWKLLFMVSCPGENGDLNHSYVNHILLPKQELEVYKGKSPQKSGWVGGSPIWGTPAWTREGNIEEINSKTSETQCGVSGNYPAVIKHGNGKWTIEIVDFNFPLKPPFIGDIPLPCLITRGYPQWENHVATNEYPIFISQHV